MFDFNLYRSMRKENIRGLRAHQTPVYELDFNRQCWILHQLHCVRFWWKKNITMTPKTKEVAVFFSNVLGLNLSSLFIFFMWKNPGPNRNKMKKKKETWCVTCRFIQEDYICQTCREFSHFMTKIIFVKLFSRRSDWSR